MWVYLAKGRSVSILGKIRIIFWAQKSLNFNYKPPWHLGYRGMEFLDLVGFDLEPLFQGHRGPVKLESPCMLLIIDYNGLRYENNLKQINHRPGILFGGQIYIWAHH